MAYEFTVKSLRTNAGLNQIEMANKIGMNVRTYRAKENGQISFSFAEVKEICKVLGISPEIVKA